MMRIHRLLSLVLPLALVACLSGTTEPTLATVETTTFAPALGVISLAFGCWYALAAVVA